MSKQMALIGNLTMLCARKQWISIVSIKLMSLKMYVDASIDRTSIDASIFSSQLFGTWIVVVCRNSTYNRDIMHASVKQNLSQQWVLKVSIDLNSCQSHSEKIKPLVNVLNRNTHHSSRQRVDPIDNWITNCQSHQ